MDESDFEGSLVLEKLAEIGAVDSFFDAIDSDDFERSRLLMEQANLDERTIEMTLTKMKSAERDH